MHTIKTSFALFIVFCGSLTYAEQLETPDYDIIEKEENFEIREYKSHLVVSTNYDLSKGETRSDAFRRLFKYISGENQAKTKISMTAPVTMSSVKINMTVPVTDQPEGTLRKMSFVVPSKFTQDTVPQPLNTLVKIEKVPGRLVAVNTFSWFAWESIQLRKAQEIKQWLASKQDYKIVSKAIYAAYDHPFKLPNLKTHEIMLVLEKL